MEVVDRYLVDDIDGKTRAGVETVSFAVDGSAYEIDLSQANQKRLYREVVTLFVEHGRKVTLNGSRPGRRGARRPRPVNGTGNAPDRGWLRLNGFPGLADRGRIPAAAQEKWDNRPA